MTAASVISRRSLFALGAGAALAASAPKAWAQAAAPAAPAGPFTLPKRAYEANALEPHIDAATMDIHYNRHHAAYVAALNAAAKDNGRIAKASVEALLAELNHLPESVRTVVRNNGGGHANHTMFWEVMGPNAGGAPSGEVAAAITRDLGGFDKFKADFEAAGLKVFGSGWIFVTVDKAGGLALLPQPNQDSPLMSGRKVLFGNDVWEHAYYLKYQNRRADYLKAWWNVVNWPKVEERYAAARAGKLAI
ncbi:superoxide dismutase [Bosea minatitlanensis]|uniref:Superoxide dismutase n=1 Tax=Bosea minatitlanensis TaxID=128782 RepID=A0ABW0F1E8_9HYPH|nr:superoxide dismutase [Bosea minatitlanensis]MCT4492039.1 superoxide dismutase [Bosea minatitlanensis]